MDVAVVGGEVVDEAPASAARLLGTTCFDTIAFQDGALLHAEAHLERLARSARTIGIGPEGGWTAVDEAIKTALSATDHDEGIVRVSLHATGHPVGLRLEEPTAEVQVLVTQPRYGDLSQGIRAVTTTIQAPEPRSWPAHVKAPCLPRFLAHREARGRGAFEGLMLDARDRVVSGTRSSLFARFGDRIVTPPSPPAFPGVTRQRLIEAARDEVDVRALPREELDGADEVWIAFTGPGVVPVVELDGEPVADGAPGDRTLALRRALGTPHPK